MSGQGGGVAKIGVLGDIHGNLEALEAVLKALDAEGVKRLACTGDVVGYGANPSECLSLVRSRCETVVAGNHDWGAVGKKALDYFNSAAREAIDWTAARLSEEERLWLSSLPLVVTREEYQLVHASFNDPVEFIYIFETQEAEASFASQAGPLAFFGHTHWPCTFFDGDPARHSIQRVVPLDPPGRFLVNPGSVGQPRDSDPRAAYAVLDLDKRTVTLRRVDYDIAAAAGKILAAGLPASLAERLSYGY